MAEKRIEPIERVNTGNEIRLVLNYKGLGDVICAAYAAAGLVHENPDKRVVFDVVEQKADWGRVFLDAEPASHKRPPEYRLTPVNPLNRYGLRYHIHEKYTRHHQWAKRVNTKPRFPKFEKPKPFDWGRVGLNRPPVVIVPESTESSRVWQPMPEHPYTNWARLAEMLERDGIPVLALSSLPFCRSYSTTTPADMMSLLASAPLIIGNDSGPQHIAGMLGKHVIALVSIDYGPGVFGYYPHVKTIQGKLPCSPCHRIQDYGYGTWCPGWCEALALIQPDEVYREAIKILSAMPPTEEICAIRETPTQESLPATCR